MLLRSTVPDPMICSWPTNSSKERGRILAARGAFCSSSRWVWCSKSVMSNVLMKDNLSVAHLRNNVVGIDVLASDFIISNGISMRC